MAATDRSRVEVSPGVGYDRVGWLVSVVLVIVAAVAWGDVIWRSVAMKDEMAGMAMDSMSPSFGAGAAFVVEWGVMMAAMMLPSALPMIALYSAVQPKTGTPLARSVSVTLFSLVYVCVWVLSGVPVYLAGRLFQDLSPDRLALVVAAVLVVAGVYQLSPLKQACLRACRSPLGFFLGHWRAGVVGSLAMGWSHAAYCIGCCWALMVVLVAAGAMGLAWVVLIAALVAAEKLAPRGDWIARLAGAALVLLGVAVALRPGIADRLLGHGAM